MKKGIIMDMDDSYLTLLTPDGEFLRARRQDIPYSIGEEILFFPLVDSVKSKRKFSFLSIFKQKTTWASIAVLLLCLGTIFPVYQSNKAYAYMSIEADSSIELGLNKKMQVVAIKGFSEDTETIISQLDNWEKKDVSELTAIILTKLKDKGVIKDKEPVIISAIETKQAKEKITTMLKENINEIKSNADNQELVVNTYVSTEEDIEKAHDLGVPVGKYHEGKKESLKKKEKPNEKSAEKNSHSGLSTKESDIPPGQLKKQTESNNENKFDKNLSESKNPAAEKDSKKELQNWNNPKSPGQLKKNDDQKANQNRSKQDNQHTSGKKNENKKGKNGKNNK